MYLSTIFKSEVTVILFLIIIILLLSAQMKLIEIFNINTYKNDNLFSIGVFYSYVEFRFTLLTWFVDDIIDFINLVNQDFGKYIFDLDNIFDIVLESLSIRGLVKIRVWIWCLILFEILQLGQNTCAWLGEDR